MAKNGTRTEQVLSFLHARVNLGDSVENLQKAYREAKPFPHLVLDNFFSPEILEGLLDELPPFDSEKWIHERYQQMVKSNLRSACDLGKRGFEFVSEIHSAGFLYLMSELTGVRALLPDPYLTASGYQAVPEGGKFDIHADRNADHFTGMRRSSVMITYLNKDWTSGLGGELELYNEDATRCEKVVEPLFNRVVIFEIADKNFHAVRPVTSGLGAMRRSFSCYFHVVENNFVAHNSLWAPSVYREFESPWRKIPRELVPPLLLRALRRKKRMM